MRSLLLLAASVAVLGVAGTVRGGAAYTVTDLGTLGGTASIAHAVNDGGQVVGEALVADSEYSHAFRTTAGGPMVDLGTFGGAQSAARDINASGQVTGVATTALLETGHAFRTNAAGVMVDLNGGNFGRSIGYSINRSGHVAGFGVIGPGLSPGHAFRTGAAGEMVDLGDFGGQFRSVSASGINGSGRIVGHYQTNDSRSGAFWTDDGDVLHDLGTLGSQLPSHRRSFAMAVNESGQIVGSSTRDEDGTLHAFRADDTGMVDLGTLNQWDTLPQSINDHGQVVGYATPRLGGDSRAFLYGQGGMTDLNTLVPTGSALTLIQARDINNLGQIVGWGLNSQGQHHAFLLTPVPEPSSSLALLSLAGLALLHHRERSRQ